MSKNQIGIVKITNEWFDVMISTSYSKNKNEHNWLSWMDRYLDDGYSLVLLNNTKDQIIKIFKTKK